MKLILAALFIVTNAFATSLHPDTFKGQPEFYSATYHLTSVKQVCPSRGGFSCMAFGSQANLTATIGCADEVVFSKVITKKIAPNKFDLYVVSVVKEGPRHIRCIQAGSHKISVYIPSNDPDVQVINTDIAQR